MTGKKKSAGTNRNRFDPYKNFKFRVAFKSVATGVRKVAKSMRAAIDAAFTRRLR